MDDHLYMLERKLEEMKNLLASLGVRTHAASRIDGVKNFEEIEGEEVYGNGLILSWYLNAQEDSVRICLCPVIQVLPAEVALVCMPLSNGENAWVVEATKVLPGEPTTLIEGLVQTCSPRFFEMWKGLDLLSVDEENAIVWLRRMVGVFLGNDLGSNQPPDQETGE